MSARKIAVRALQENDIDALIALAGSIWREHYPGIISDAQIEYMLDQRYRPDLLSAELERDDLWWELASIGATLIGFSSCLLTDTGTAMKLDKLYVEASRQGMGVGGQLLQSVVARARRLRCERLVLAVNRRNANAISAYRRWGFCVERAAVKDIGGGFVMDDYVMVLTL